jgi:hypothetical protein
MGAGFWVLLGLAGLVAVFIGYGFFVRPWTHRWGAIQAEVSGVMPGDDLVPLPRTGYTQAITIDAPPAAVWPWLVQIGYQRAGWYTYDWIYRLLRAADFYDGRRSADRIIPELQDLKVGDTVKIFSQGPFEVVQLAKEQALVLLARVDLDSGKPFELRDPMPNRYLNNSWAYRLEPVERQRTRLIVRWRGDYSPGLANLLGMAIPTDAGALLMQPKMLQGIRERAEARADESPLEQGPARPA